MIFVYFRTKIATNIIIIEKIYKINHIRYFLYSFVKTLKWNNPKKMSQSFVVR